ncbi:hypothetical protein Cni_G06879 [Canna indica]|uniref:NAC domain-containing protein n=1 Tax=Canna indica TaxID=4628 RepID=A0AAQ3Q706_9LILI|nr:hypothetical protein Cni_G06879 [Canna indica]
MSISVNGQSSVPPGFRFHPTEEELLSYYLRKKVTSEKIDLDVIRDVDLNKLEPWDIQEKCRIGSTPQNDWYFFSQKDKKYPTGTRTNRATAAGFWKATGRDKVIYSSVGRIGMRKTLVFYKGRAPHGQKSDWIMHEYRLDDHSDLLISQSNSNSSGTTMGEEEMSQEDGWVVCRVFKKKSNHKAGESPKNSSSVTSDAKTQLMHPDGGGGALDQILQYMSRSCRREISGDLHHMFMKIPALSPMATPSLPNHNRYTGDDNQASYDLPRREEPGVGSWAAFDRLLASQLNGTSTEEPKALQCCDVDQNCLFAFSSSERMAHAGADDYEHGDGDLWSLTGTSSSLSSNHISRASQ